MVGFRILQCALFVSDLLDSDVLDTVRLCSACSLHHFRFARWRGL